MDERDRQHLEDSPPTQRVREAGHLPFVRGPDGLFRLGQRPDGRCVYLRADRLCAVHRESGMAAKPRVCQVFPFLPVRTPDGIFVGLSFRCSAVQQDHGRPLAAHAADVEAMVAGGCAEIRPPFLLAPGVELTWDGYLRAEALVSAGDVWPAAARLARAALGAPPGFVDATALEALLEPPPEKSAEAMAMEQLAAASLVAWLETDRPEEMEALTRGLPAGAPFLSRRLNRWVEPARLPRPGSWIEPEIERYVGALVFRKFLALGSSVLARLWLLHALGPVLRFYTGLSAWAAGRGEPTPEDLHRAWEVVEGEVASHVEGLDPLFESLAAGFREALA